VALPADNTPVPAWLDRWAPWLWGAVVLVIASYGPMLFQLVTNATYWSRGLRVW
jgi:cytochrome c oxidase subunit 1